MYTSKKAKTVKTASKKLFRGDAGAKIMVTGARKTRPAAHSLRGLDPKTVEILIDDKIATGG